ncbi:MAG: DNA mismatch repair protein MutS [Spirochaetaceae bacterium]|nr:MAG: DNA mismatch repair protein MutS [Spirochaetaceae bacterium]
MLKQYEELKARHRDAILLFRLGDFYEMFGGDAREGSRLLGLTLTQRQGTPMCGVPHHAARGYIGRLLRHGRKVAICEQTSVPDGKNLATREVVEVLSPGTVFDQEFLDPENNNFLLALGRSGDNLCVGWCDASTGELTLAAYPLDNPGDPRHLDALLQREMARLTPREILVQESVLEHSPWLAGRNRTDLDVVVNRIPDWGFDADQSLKRLREILQVENLHGFGFDEDDPALLTGAPLIEYLEENARHVLGHLHNVRRHRDDSVVILDDATLRNLEITTNMHDGTRKFTLLSVLDQTGTPMGGRLLRRRLTAPTRIRAEIERRLNQVDELYHRQSDLQSLRSLLEQTYDLERLTGRLGVERAHPRDLVAIAASIRIAAAVADLVPDWFGGAGTGLLEETEQWETVLAIEARIRAVIDDDPGVALNEGGIIREGYDAELDRLRRLQGQSRSILEEYLREQRRDTGISTLKIRYNRMLGHFFEVPRSQAEKIPESFIRRQSLANAERFTTPRLSELETEINNATEDAVAREQELFLALRQEVAGRTAMLGELAHNIGCVDVAAALARAATLQGYRRPLIREEPLLNITGGRHPVVEANLPPGDFVPNDLSLDSGTVRFGLITGPNMAGKSTVLRQTALITLMAHAGSFVPADVAEIGITDRIYCRVGASDNIARGESTFLVEMNETSNILRNAGTASLVIMDEVGRGTSTHDGLSIAWAVCEYLLNRTRCRTLFATHYHELTEIEGEGFARLTMTVEHSPDRIVFLKKLRPGSADRSYGVDVARMAGIPEEVIHRARQLLAYFEAHSIVRDEPPERETRTEGATPSQEELFTPGDLILTELAGLDPDRCTPREAHSLLYRWKELLPR